VTRDEPIDPSWIVGVRVALLEHFDVHARDLPWRRTRDPYAIWISEVMLQQTRVDAVVPYYERWLERFPDVHTLADAQLDDVLKAWEGLGYYSRACNLHRAAAVVRERHAGSLPADYDALRALPGVGEYTAGAVASIAYGVRRPAVDGNVRRVVARLLDDPAPSAARLRDIVTSLVPQERAGDFNQALMELGATVCSPRTPRCDVCPLVPWCAARLAGTQADRPAPRRSPSQPLFLLATAVICAPPDQVLLIRRPAHGLLANLWSFPSREVSDVAFARDAALDIARELVGRATARHVTALAPVDHVFSHRRERYLCWRIDIAKRTRSTRDDVVWTNTHARDLAMPRAQRRILRTRL
jgi:A/G-specific adenine glycosylase